MAQAKEKSLEGLEIAHIGYKRKVAEHTEEILKLFGWVTLLLVLGCSSQECLFQSDCAPGLVCAESECRQSCDDERQCNVGDTCIEGACFPDPLQDCDAADGCTRPDAQIIVVTADAMIVELTDVGEMVDYELPVDAAQVDMSIPESNDFPDEDLTEDRVRQNLEGVYTVVHTLKLSSGGELGIDAAERNIVELTEVAGDSYEVEVRDELGRTALHTAPSVNFAHRDGPGYFDFRYPWNVRVDERCFHVEVRDQQGTYQRVDRGYQLIGRESREICTCYRELLTGVVPSIQANVCQGERYRQEFDVEWIPL